MTYDVLIVGGGPAGNTAGMYAVRAGLRTLVLTGREPGGQIGTTEEVENYPGILAIGGMELAEKMRQSAERDGAEFRWEQAAHLSPLGQEKAVETAQGRYCGRTIIYAAGAEPRTLGVPGEAELRGRGVSYCAACDGMFFRNRTVMVVGGGNSAAAEALTLSRLCKKVYLLHRRDTLRAEHRYLELLQAAGNIIFLWNARVEAILGGSAVQGVTYTELCSGERRETACDGVFVAAGRKANTELLMDWMELDKNGYVPADETTRTAIPGFFAAGDVRTKILRQVVTAAADGAVAAHMAKTYLEQ